MKKSAFLAAACAAALLAACGIGGPDYPEFAQTQYRIEGNATDPTTGATTQTVIYRDGPQMRVEAAIPGYGPAVVVFDQAADDAYVLTSMATPPLATLQPGQTAPNAQPAAPTTTPPNAPAAQPDVAPPAAQRTGVAVRLDDANAPQAMETAWAALGAENARSVGECEVAGESGHEWTPREAPAPGVERTACITSDGIVLRLRENAVVLWEATSLQRGVQNASLFGVPATYQVLDPEAVAEGVGETLENLDSVTGEQPAPQQAPAPRG